MAQVDFAISGVRGIGGVGEGIDVNGIADEAVMGVAGRKARGNLCSEISSTAL